MMAIGYDALVDDERGVLGSAYQVQLVGLGVWVTEFAGSIELATVRPELIRGIATMIRQYAPINDVMNFKDRLGKHVNYLISPPPNAAVARTNWGGGWGLYTREIPTDDSTLWSTERYLVDADVGQAVWNSLIEEGAIIELTNTNLRTKRISTYWSFVAEGLNLWESTRLLILEPHG